MADEAQSSQTQLTRGWRDRAKAIAPWCIALAAIAYVFTRVPITEAWAVARTARLEFFLTIVFTAVIVWFAIESSLYTYLFRRFNAPVTLREACSLRGMSYLLTPIHWNVGQAAIVLRLKQTRQIPLLESTSTLLFYQAIDGVILAGFATIGMLLLASLDRDLEGLSGILGWTIGIVVLSALNLAVLRTRWPRLRWLTWWRGIKIHRVHRRFTLRDLTILLIGKSAYHFLYVLVVYFGTQAFDIHLPFALVLASTPIIQAVGGLPISPAGLGTQQAAMLYFFGGRFGSGAPEAAIVAFGFSFPVALILGRSLLGLFYLKDLSQARQESDPTEAPDVRAEQSPGQG